MQKGPAILRALDYLRHHLGDGCFVVADHWIADRMAVGIAHPTDPARLVYIACSDETASSYTVTLEHRPPTGVEHPYEECGRFNDLDLKGLASIVAAHLRNQEG